MWHFVCPASLVLLHPHQQKTWRLDCVVEPFACCCCCIVFRQHLCFRCCWLTPQNILCLRLWLLSLCAWSESGRCVCLFVTSFSLFDFICDCPTELSNDMFICAQPFLSMQSTAPTAADSLQLRQKSPPACTVRQTHFLSRVLCATPSDLQLHSAQHTAPFTRQSTCGAVLLLSIKPGGALIAASSWRQHNSPDTHSSSYTLQRVPVQALLEATTISNATSIAEVLLP